MIFTFHVPGKTKSKCVRIKFYKLLFLKFQLAALVVRGEQ